MTIDRFLLRFIWVAEGITERKSLFVLSTLSQIHINIFGGHFKVKCYYYVYSASNEQSLILIDIDSGVIQTPSDLENLLNVVSAIFRDEIHNLVLSSTTLFFYASGTRKYIFHAEKWCSQLSAWSLSVLNKKDKTW